MHTKKTTEPMGFLNFLPKVLRTLNWRRVRLLIKEIILYFRSSLLTTDRGKIKSKEKERKKERPGEANGCKVETHINKDTRVYHL